MDTRRLVDPELLEMVDEFASFALNAETLPGLRAQFNAPETEDGSGDGLPLVVRRRWVPGRDGSADVPVLVIMPAAAGPERGAILHIHGDGFVFGNPGGDLVRLRKQVAELDCVMVSVDYPLAPEAIFPAGLEACYSALCWLVEESRAFGVDPRRIGIAGESAGAALGVGLALLTRDRNGPRLAFQNYVYPMLDDRPRAVANPVTGQFIWTRESNAFAWTSVLGVAAGSDGVSPYAAPARAHDVGGLPPTYISVGALDLLLDESVEFAMRLAAAGVPVELAVYPKAVHAFNLAPESGVFRRAFQQRMEALARALASPSGPAGTPA